MNFYFDIVINRKFICVFSDISKENMNLAVWIAYKNTEMKKLTQFQKGDFDEFVIN